MALRLDIYIRENSIGMFLYVRLIICCKLVFFCKKKVIFMSYNKFVSNVLIDVYDQLSRYKCMSLIYKDLSELNSFGFLYKTINHRCWIRFIMMLLLMKYIIISLLTRNKELQRRYKAMKVVLCK